LFPLFSDDAIFPFSCTVGAVLQFAMRKWRLKVGDLGFDLSDGMPHLIDLRFADDILLFTRSGWK